MPDVYNSYAYGKYTIYINHDMISQVNLIYNLIHLDFLNLITLMDFNRAK